MRLKPVPIVAAEGFCDPAAGDEQRARSLVAALRQHIARMDGSAQRFDRRRRAAAAPWATGIAAVDAHLPLGGLARAGLHDVTPAAYGDSAAAMAFVVALALSAFAADARDRRPLLWCRLQNEAREHGKLYGHGLEALGLPRARFLTVTLKTPMAVLWTMEEALRSGALSLVIADADPRSADLTATRRLVLAGGAGRAAGLLVFTRDAGAATASHTRWRVASAPSQAPPHDAQAPGAPAWTIELTRARGGRPGLWQMEWQHAPHRFNLVSGLSGGAFHPHADENGIAPAGEAGAALRAG